jgi:hypothetical protein
MHGFESKGFIFPISSLLCWSRHGLFATELRVWLRKCIPFRGANAGTFMQPCPQDLSFEGDVCLRCRIVKTVEALTAITNKKIIPEISRLHPWSCPLCLISKACGGSAGIAPPFFTSALDKGELNTRWGTRWAKAGWVPRAGLDALKKRENLGPARNWSRSSNHVTRRYTDWAVPVLKVLCA